MAGETDALREELESILQSIKDLKFKACTANKSGSEDGGDLAAAARQCEHALRNGPGGDLRKYAKNQRKPLILRLLFGNRAAVRAAQSDEAFRMKEEYHSFRSQAARMIICMAGALLILMQRSLHMAQGDGSDKSVRSLAAHSFTPVIMVGVQMFLGYMIYFYTAMACRESLLLLNGSNIRNWWIVHHYLAGLTCLITLALPVDSAALQSFVKGWLRWTVLQAVLIFAQNMYQQKRMYTRIALGKSSAMDVVGGESSGGRGQLFALLPGLFVLQGSQIFMGIRMVLLTGPAVVDPRGWLELEAHETDLRALRGLFVVGTLLTGMGFMNALNTVRTVAAKRHPSATPRPA